MCTTVIVGRLASTTGRVILGHNEDSGGRCMHQQFWVPGGSHSAGHARHLLEQYACTGPRLLL